MFKGAWLNLPEKMRGEKNESELSIEVLRSRISLKGADNEDSLRGSGLHGVVFDEVASYKMWDYLWEDVMRPALSDHQGFAWFIGTPQGFNHFYELFKREEKSKEYKSFHFTSYDNPFLLKDEIEQARRDMTEDAFAQEYMADFRKFTGLIYKEFDRKVHIIEPIDIPSHWQIYRAMDFGAKNPTVCLWIAVDTVDNVYVFDEYYRSGERSSFHANVIKAKTDRDVLITYGDPSAEQEQLDYAEHEVYITPADKFTPNNKSWVNYGIGRVAELLKVDAQTGKPKLFVFKHCENIIREFESYRWMEKRDELNSRETPEKVDDHAMDALRYFVVSYSGNIKEESQSIRIVGNKFTGY